MRRIGIYLGSAVDNTENVVRVIREFNASLKNNWEVDFYGSASLPHEVDVNRAVATTHQTPKNPLSHIFTAYNATREYISERDPDVLLQLWKYKVHAPGVTLGGWQADVPTVIRYNGDTFEEYRAVSFPKKPFIYGLDHIVGRIPLILAERAIIFGPYGQQCLTQRGFDSHRTSIVPPPLDRSGRFSPAANKAEVREELGLQKDEEVALFVGRLSELKGMSFLEETIHQVTQSRDMTFVLVGEGPTRERFQKSFDDEVQLPGYVSHEAIHSYYRAADVYIHPSAFEGLPLVVLEALQCGVPVVARSAGDIGLVTEQTVETPAELAEILMHGDWQYQWNNRELFEREYQCKQIVNLVDSIFKGA